MQIFIYILFVRHTIALQSRLLPTDIAGERQNSQAVEWINDIIPFLTRYQKTNNVVLINIYFKTASPIVTLNTKTGTPPNLSLGDVSIPTAFCIQTSSISQLYDVVNRLGIYRQILNSAWFFIILPENLTKQLRGFLKKSLMFRLIFLKMLESGDFELLDSKGNAVPKDFPNWYKVQNAISIRICYHEYIPYTFIPPASTGVEQDMIDLASKYLKIKITYVKQNLSFACSQNGQFAELWQSLYNHSCDGVIGIMPCLKDFPYFDISASYLFERTVLVVPKVNCVRHVGMVQLDISVAATLLLSFLSTKIATFLLSKEQNDDSVQQIVSMKLQIKLLILSLSLLSYVIISGLFQGKIYDILVHNGGHCGLKNIDDILRQKSRFGIEEIIFDGVTSTFSENEKLRALKDYWELDTNMEQLDTTKCHILRDISYHYQLAQHYTTLRGEPLFNRVQELQVVHISAFFSKRHFILDNITYALLVVLQSGLNKKMGKLVSRMSEANKENDLLSYFLPVKVHEIVWLVSFCAIFQSISVLVFIGEVLMSKYKVIFRKFISTHCS